MAAAEDVRTSGRKARVSDPARGVFRRRHRAPDVHRTKRGPRAGHRSKIRENIEPPNRPLEARLAGAETKVILPHLIGPNSKPLYLNPPAWRKMGGCYNSDRQKRRGEFARPPLIRGPLVLAPQSPGRWPAPMEAQPRWGNFSCPGFVATDGVSQGLFAARKGPHASHCKPRSSAAEVAAARADVISKSGALDLRWLRFASPVRLSLVSLSSFPLSALASRRFRFSSPVGLSVVS